MVGSEIGPENEDQELVKRLQADGEDGLAEVLAHFQPRLRQMIQVRIHPAISGRIDPSDVIQEVYLDAAQQIDGYLQDRKVALYVWLRTLTWERLIKLQRRHLGTQRRDARREASLPADSTMCLARQLISKQTSPSQALIRDELQRRVQGAIDTLRDEDRDVILMRDFEGMSNGEVAQTLAISPSGATKRYGRAIFRLKLAMDAAPAE